jgi:uncharacterized protein YktB (UPF0637 family)
VTYVSRFQGFTDRDYNIFDIPDFASRMPAIRASISPKLQQIGDLLAPPLSRLVGGDLYPHVARHMRRTVHPPEETWVAFSRSPRAYKPYMHYRLTIHAQGLKIACFLEDYADEDRPTFTAGLAANAHALARYLSSHPQICSYDLRDGSGRPLCGESLNAKALVDLAERLKRVKGQHIQFGVPIDRSDTAAYAPQALQEAALSAMQSLLPLYRMGAEEGYRL